MNLGCLHFTSSYIDIVVTDYDELVGPGATCTGGVGGAAVTTESGGTIAGAAWGGSSGGSKELSDGGVTEVSGGGAGGDCAVSGGCGGEVV
ncbi:hypothetical protein Tco_0698184 [Tanacetum coccineum]